MQIDDTITKANFNPRSPCGERRCDRLSNCFSAIFQSTLPVRGATGLNACGLHSRWISIHAPRAGSDGLNACGLHSRWISIHAPRAGSDADFANTTPFLYISIHAPRAGSDIAALRINSRYVISIHAPRAGSDLMGECDCSRTRRFQSTLPVRGATPVHRGKLGADPHFNPRSPCGERPASLACRKK